ncbi:hypothetical protein SOVF_094310 isoform B [Spinacia oleracea]|nr:hypothetical protein SOVF_094310 isoform B [Spinacia oleracea]
MGLKLRMDLPEQEMEVATVFFRNSTPASEAAETLKKFSEEREKKLKALQEKMQLGEKEAKRFSPVDAFPGDIVIFTRVLNLLRGLSATMDVRIVYFDIMRPFAESALGGEILERYWEFILCQGHSVERTCNMIKDARLCCEPGQKPTGSSGVAPDAMFPVLLIWKARKHLILHLYKLILRIFICTSLFVRSRGWI